MCPQFLLLSVILVVAQTMQDVVVTVTLHHLVVIAQHLVDMVLIAVNNTQVVSVVMDQVVT
tara:strand:+ start:221 stop:403 length:183 start_codon:yes stop_codon:yes gene_type:complete